MKYTVVLLIMLIGFFDGGLVFVFLSKGLLVVSMVWHISLSLIIILLGNIFLKKNHGVSNYLALFLPGIGGIMVALVHFALLHFKRNSTILGSYEQYVNYQRSYDLHKDLDFAKEIKTISFLDRMNLLDSKSKKQLILESAEEANHRIKIFQKGLTDTDGEVQHYSAVSINILENDYTDIINKVREEFNEIGDLESLKRLVKAYEGYLESGLLSEDSFNLFNQEYIEVLSVFMTRRKESPEPLIKLVKAYLRAGNYIMAKELNLKLVQKYPNNPVVSLNQLQIAYEEKNYQQIYEQAISEPSLAEENLSFWQNSRSLA